MFHLSIKTKLSAGLSLVLLVAFIAINLLNYQVSRTAVRQSILNDALPGISNEIFNEIQGDLIVPIQVSSLMANDTFLKDWILAGERDTSKILKYLWEIKRKYDFFSTFLVSESTKHYYHFRGLHKTMNPQDDHDDWYYNFIDGGKDYIVEVDTNEAARGTLTVFINHRLNDYEGNLIGVTGVGLNMGEVGRMLQSYQERYSKKIYLVDRDGLIQVHPDQHLIQKVNIREVPGIGEVASSILAGIVSPVAVEYDDKNAHKLVRSQFVPEFDWFLIVEHSEGDDLQELRETFIINLIIGFAVTLLVIIINVLMVHHFQGRLELMATIDELTKVPNRRSFFCQAKRDLSRCIRSGAPASLLMIDIDHFKRINDTHGHTAGDLVLKETAKKLSETLREGDLAGRLGGEEFAILLPNTEHETALQVAERLRLTVATHIVLLRNSTCMVTLSIGVATEQGPDITLESLLAKADNGLYTSKHQGRDRVSLACE